MLSKLLTLAFLLLTVVPVSAQAPDESASFFSDCRRPLILYTEIHTSGDTPLWCLTVQGTKNLGLNGFNFIFSSSKRYVAYIQEQGSRRQNGSASYGDLTLIVNDTVQNRHFSWHTGYGNLVYDWLDDSHLIVSRWVDNLGFYTWEYPVFYVIDVEHGGIIHPLDWERLRLLSYVTGEKRLIFSDYSKALFTAIWANKLDLQPFLLPEHGSPYRLVASKDGQWVAYQLDYSDGNCFTSTTQLVDRRNNIHFNVSETPCNDQHDTALSFSDDGQFLALQIEVSSTGKSYAGVYRIADRELIFQIELSETGFSPMQWISGTDTLILIKSTSANFTDLYSFDAVSQKLDRLTDSPTSKSLP